VWIYQLLAVVPFAESADVAFFIGSQPPSSTSWSSVKKRMMFGEPALIGPGLGLGVGAGVGAIGVGAGTGTMLPLIAFLYFLGTGFTPIEHS
jgi:hypothetical protein